MGFVQVKFGVGCSGVTQEREAAAPAIARRAIRITVE